ncbi:sugar ABC transporter ATP-binding protein [uncultured Jatrophihabitans sp.]|uniref:sugar ABC transporter ATP-binding protein n=1 Tax=uncultured Jatrophihabitans sp. TaxID=1610747 RepID=UPI0035C9B8B8
MTKATAPSTATAEPGASRPPWVSVRGLSKTFGPAQVLRDVDFTARSGEIHGLVGQNGSGKSTLIKVLSGVHPADAGSAVEIDGTRLANPVRPRELREHGLAFVHQDLGLVEELTVLENIRLGQYSAHRLSRRIDWRTERSAARQTLERLHSDIDTSRLVSTLHPGEKAIVAIGRALQNLLPGTGCVVFDESTRALPRDLLPDFYATIRRLAATGTAIILVSHRLDEVLALTDRVTVLQDGRVVAGDRETKTLTEASLASLLLGREIELLEERAPAQAPSHAGHTAAVLRARGIHGEFLRGVDLDVAPGEVVGITGGANSGHAELPAILAGVAAKGRGNIDILGRAFTLPSTRPGQLIAAGVAFVPEDRGQEGLAVELSAQDNLTLPRARARGRLMLRSGWQAAEFREAVAMLGIVPAKRNLPCSSFSGGNQQKILLAKWLLNNPEVVLLNEPTQAVDVGARIDILRAIRAAADRGVGVVLASIETQDLAAVCDRVLVFRDGVVAAELTTDLSPHTITAATYPVPVAAG